MILEYNEIKKKIYALIRKLLCFTPLGCKKKLATQIHLGQIIIYVFDSL